jgi:hypothetical protein
MKRVIPVFESKEIEQRAAEVRRQWSFSERIRRTGLPPDMPIRMRLWPESVDRVLMSGCGWRACAAFAATRAES